MCDTRSKSDEGDDPEGLERPLQHVADRMPVLRNDTDHKFVDISSELWREYTFVSGAKVRIGEPAYLSVSPDNGGARILTMDGRCVYIPYGWVAIEWQVREDAPHFVR